MKHAFQWQRPAIVFILFYLTKHIVDARYIRLLECMHA